MSFNHSFLVFPEKKATIFPTFCVCRPWHRVYITPKDSPRIKPPSFQIQISQSKFSLLLLFCVSWQESHNFLTFWPRTKPTSLQTQTPKVKFRWKISSNQPSSLAFPDKKATIWLQPARSVSWGEPRVTRRWLQSILGETTNPYCVCKIWSKVPILE